MQRFCQVFNLNFKFGFKNIPSLINSRIVGGLLLGIYYVFIVYAKTVKVKLKSDHFVEANNTIRNIIPLPKHPFIGYIGKHIISPIPANVLGWG